MEYKELGLLHLFSKLSGETIKQEQFEQNPEEINYSVLNNRLTANQSRVNNTYPTAGIQRKLYSK